MDVLALILACSIHPDDALVRALVQVQSGGNPYFVGDLSTLKTVDNLSGREEALRAAEGIKLKGGRPAVGLLGVPLEWAARFGYQPKDLFDGCTNLAAGSAMLVEYQEQCTAATRTAPGKGRRAALRRTMPRHRPQAALRACVLTKLASDLGLKSDATEVLAIVARNTNPSAVDSPAEESAIFSEGEAGSSDANWSSPRMYIDPGAVPNPSPDSTKPVSSLKPQLSMPSPSHRAR